MLDCEPSAAAFVLAVIPAHIVWLNERKHPDASMSTKYFPGIFQVFAYGLGMLAAQPDDMPKHWADRVVGILRAFVSVVFVADYTATSAAFLAEQGITCTGAPVIRDCYTGITNNIFDAVVCDAPVTRRWSAPSSRTPTTASPSAMAATFGNRPTMPR